MRTALVLIAIVILAGCSPVAPTAGPTPLPAALAHIETTSARLKVLIEQTESESVNFMAVLPDLPPMVDTLQAEAKWLEGNADPSSASEGVYLDRVTRAITALDRALNEPTTETVRAARSAVVAAANAADRVVTLAGT